MYKYLMGENEEEGARLFSVVLTDRTAANRHKHKKKKKKNPNLNTTTHLFFYCGLVKHWNRLSRDLAPSSSLETTQIQAAHSPGKPALVAPA